VEPFPSLHTRRLSSRTAMFYVATGITPAMCMRLTNVGSQYLAANLDRSGEPIDGARTYKMLLPPGIAAAAFWSVTVNWIQTDPAKDWFLLLRLYSPLPTFFDNTWCPGEPEPVE
jgi:hypothetical protein